jgi:hypothetical protein
MSYIASRETDAKKAFAAKAVLPVMAATICLSAFLLFSVQPFFAKMVLPRLGGSPAVWSVAMVFFQAILLAGYGYAHLLSTRLSLRASVLCHLAVMAIASAALPIAVPGGWDRPPESGQAFWLIGLFCISIGLPFFAISANSSLLQGWFARTGHAQARDPYFLYGASNIGSFASLILYVVLFEPMTTLSGQNTLWTGGFLILLISIAASGYLAATLNSTTGLGARSHHVEQHGSGETRRAPGASWQDRLTWVAYAFIPSALLVAVTAHVQTDVAAAPFLWIAPLALFLLTFVIVFQNKPIISHSLAKRMAPVTTVLLLFMTLTPVPLPLSVQILGHFGGFFLIALSAHSALAARRPDAGRLTEFYFCMSAGGVLGGVFSSLLAMHLFTWIAEYPLLLVISLLTAERMRGDNPGKYVAVMLIATLAICGLLALVDLTTSFHPLSDFRNLQVLNMALSSAALYFLFRQALLVPVICGVMFVSTYLFVSVFYSKVESRSFFGVLRVVDDVKNGVRSFQHGTTLHGATRLSDLEPDVRRPLPLTYYADDGGINSAIKAVRKNLGGKISYAGVVGVGAGSLACQFDDGERLDLFEIDPEVVRIAQDPQLFPFLSKCGAGSTMITGDGRIELESIPDRKYDVLVVDAFSSDSIPVHLLTLEAIELYMRKLTENGVLVMHISNQHLELKSLVGAIAKELGLTVRTAKFIPQNTPETLGMATPSDVAVIAVDEARLGHVLGDSRWAEPDINGTVPWTDGYSNMIAALWRRYAD